MCKNNHYRAEIQGVLRLVFLLLLGSVGLISCDNSGLDPETAEVVIGDGKDTTSLPDLQKVTLEAGFVGDELKVVTEFVNFRRLARYSVDTLDNGSVTVLRGVMLEAALGHDSSTDGVVERLEPLRYLRVFIAQLPVSVSGKGEEVDLVDDPADMKATIGGIKAELANGEVLMTDALGRMDNWGSAHVSSVNERNRTIVLRIQASLLNRPNQSPNPSLRQLKLNMVMELSY